MTNQPTKTQWQYLEPRADSWRKQLYLKGTRIKAFTLWMNMIVNEMTPSEVAYNWELPIEAVHEAIKYCESHQELLEEEAQKERRYLEERGIPLEPKIIN